MLAIQTRLTGVITAPDVFGAKTTGIIEGAFSFNTGVPFQPFSRNPQIRFTYRINNFYASVTALTQADFKSTGSLGPSSSYLRNSSMPVRDVTMKYKIKSLVVGAGANYKTLLPRLQDISTSEEKYITDSKISSMSAMGFAKVVINDFVIKAEVIYGENLTDLLTFL